MDNVLVNGESANCINVKDRGLAYGDGLFETIMVEKGIIVFLDEHFNRLERGCKILSFPPLNKSLYRAEIGSMISAEDSGILKIILTRGVSERGYLPPSEPSMTRVLSFNSDINKHINSLKKINMRLCQTRLSQQPLLAGIKHLNQLERVLARSEWNDSKVHEGLMMDQNNHIIEGTMSNVFVVKNGSLITSDLSKSGVQGVIRDVVLQQGIRLGIPCTISTITLEDVLDADEVFITNSLILVQSVMQVNIENSLVKYNQSEIAQLMFDAIHRDIAIQCEGEG